MPDTHQSAVATTPPRPWLVALPLPLAALEFAAPFGYQGQPPVGAQVLVPMRGTPQLGLVVGSASGRANYQLHEALGILRPNWITATTVQAISEWAKSFRILEGLLWSDLLGAAWKSDYRHWVRAWPNSDLSAFGERGEIPSIDWQLATDFAGKLLQSIRSQGLLEERFELLQAMRSVIVLSPKSDKLPPLTAKQQQALIWLTEQPQSTVTSKAQWSRAAGVGASVVNQLIKHGYASQQSVPAEPPLLTSASPAQPPPPPPPQDQLPNSTTWRLHGGRAAQRWQILAPRILKMLQQGQAVALLTPDLHSLGQAWQALGPLAELAGTRAVQLGGHLKEAQRQYTRQLIAKGEARFILGSYQILTALPQNLGLLLVLEESSDAYKLLRGSRIFAPDLAQTLAQAHQAQLGLVGSVPAVESVKFEGLVLPPVRQRLHIVDYSRPPQQPEVGPLSLPRFRPQKMGYPLSHQLTRLLRQVAERGRQAVLLAPRRGYSALLQCGNCQHIPQCQNCDLPLRYHQEEDMMHCHQCGYKSKPPKKCECCGDQLLKARGAGTEWIAAEVKRLAPDLTIWRLDKDYSDDLSALNAGETGVLVGTQRIFSQAAPPNLALIGLTLADTWFNISDFRASERYHRLLRQLTEWHPSRAPLLLVQTLQGQHPALLAVSQEHDALYYPQSELASRKLLHYPPFAQLARIELSHKKPEKSEQAAQTVAEALLSQGAAPTELLGPTAGFVTKLRGEYPYQLLLRAHNNERLGELLEYVKNTNIRAKLRIDINPRSSIWQEGAGSSF